MATAFGAVLAVNPLMALIALAIVAIVVLISKRMSLGSIVGLLLRRYWPYFWNRVFWICDVMAIIMLIKHRANIVRLIHGEEPIWAYSTRKDKRNNRNRGRRKGR